MTHSPTSTNDERTLISRSLTLWFIVMILLLASATRIHDLALRSLWEDEGWTLLLAQGPTLPDIVQRMANDQHPPLFFIIFHYWRDLVGSSEFAMRTLSVLTGLIAVAGMYQLGKSMFGRYTGLLAALLLALSDHHIDLSQDVRHYSQLATLIILSSWFYFRMLRSANPTRSTRIGYVLISMALLYSHYLGGFVLIVQLVHMVVYVRPIKRLWWVFFHWGAGCAGFLPWLPIVYVQNNIRWVTPLYYLNAMPNNHRTVVMVRDALLGKQYAITLFLIALGLVWISYAGSRLKIRWRPTSPVFFAVVWAVAYTAFTFYMNSQKQFLTIRNFILVTPAVIVLTAHGLANLQTGLRNFLLAVLVIVSLTTVDTRQLKAPWREVVQNVTEFHNDDEPVLMDIWVGDFPARYYVQQQMGDATPFLSIRETADEEKGNFLPFMLDYVQDEDAFWLLKWGDDPSPLGYDGIFATAGFQRTASPYIDHVGNKLYSFRYDRVTDDRITTYQANGEAILSLQKFARHGDFKAGNTITVTLWWIAEMPAPVDYSVSVFVLDENGTLVAQHDGPPLDGQAPTSTWEVGRIQYDQHDITLPDNLAPGEYTLGVKVYFYQTSDQPLQATCTDDADALCDWRGLDVLTVD